MPPYDFGFAVDRIYEAAFRPDLWPSLLDDMTLATGSGAGAIGIYWPRQKGISSTLQISPGREPWEQTPEKSRTWLKHVRSGKYVNRGFFQIDPSQGDWSDIPDFDERIEGHVERGFGPQTGTIIELFDGEIVTLEFTRKAREPRYDDFLVSKLNEISNAFKQSVFFASRIYFEQARGSVETLNAVGLPAALLGGNGQVLYTNTLFNDVSDYFVSRPFEKIAVTGSDVLRKAFAQALELLRERDVTLPIPADETRNAAIIHLMPIRREARSIFAASYTIMIVSPVAATVGVPPAELVSKLFRLTPAEARLAVALTSGLSLRDCAAGLGIVFGTARSYLLRIFSKTGTSQQSELVSLVKSISAAEAGAAAVGYAASCHGNMRAGRAT